ncbi:uncharacterized protein [Sinocyclocheilus grahami]|uniref:uncharacterized protein n=1 Tax=Sinocyclocheilus grahami TaxID=75366 RepID=UPI0007ACDF12|nr:PREDICTED: uncharacterized protein LOC107559669 [Sinocyclocheilus grahami]
MIIDVIIDTDGSQYENGETAHDGSQIESPETPEMESNGNGHKQLLNGGETGFTGTSQIQGTDGFDSFGTSPHLEITGIIDQSSHDLLVGLMGERTGESFGPETQTDGLDHMGLAFQVDSAAAGLSPGHPSSGGPVLDAPPDYLSVDNGNGDYTHSISMSDNGAQSKSPADTTDSSVVFDTMSHPGHSFIDYSDGGADNNGADLPDTNGNGNGRHKPVVDIQKGDPPGILLDISGTGHQDAATEMHHTAVGALDLNDHTLSPYTDMIGFDSVTGARVQTDMAGAAGDPVTDGQTLTDMTGQGHLAVTDSMPNYTADSVRATGTGFTDASETHSSMVQTDLPVTGDQFTGVSSQTDAMGTGQPGATEQTQTAVSAGEQYHTSGQGPEGAENVELEDTC